MPDVRTTRPGRGTLPATAAAVLGLVALGARSGYEVLRAAERSVRFFWALGPPQVYAELKRLEADGLLVGHDESQGARARRTYDVTARGREALEAWITHEEPAPLELRDATLVRLFLADAVSPEEARLVIARMRVRSVAAVAQFDTTILPSARRVSELGAMYPEHVAAFGRALHEFIIEWCDRLEAALDDDRPPGPG